MWLGSSFAAAGSGFGCHQVAKSGLNGFLRLEELCDVLVKGDDQQTVGCPCRKTVGLGLCEVKVVFGAQISIRQGLSLESSLSNQANQVCGSHRARERPFHPS